MITCEQNQLFDYIHWQRFDMNVFFVVVDDNDAGPIDMQGMDLSEDANNVKQEQVV